MAPGCLHRNLGSPCSFHLALLVSLCSLALKCVGLSLLPFLEVTLTESSRVGRAELIPNPAEQPFMLGARVWGGCAEAAVCPCPFCMLSPSAPLCRGGPTVFYHWGQHHKGGIAAFLKPLQDSQLWWCARDLPKFRKLSRADVTEKTTTGRGSQPRDVRKPQLSPLNAPGSLWTSIAAIPFLPGVPVFRQEYLWHL